MALSLRTYTIYAGVLLILTGCATYTHERVKAAWCFLCWELDVEATTKTGKLPDNPQSKQTTE